jgi:hypothetical protein
MRLPACVLSFAIVSCVAGCAPSLHVRIDRQSGTGLADRDRIAVVVVRNDATGSNGNVSPESSTCLKSSLNSKLSRSGAMDMDVFLNAVFQNVDKKNIPAVLVSADFPKTLAVPAVTARMESLGIRYVVVGQLSTSVGAGFNKFEHFEGSSSVGIGIGNSYEQSTTYWVDVFDKQGRSLGALTIYTFGGASSGVGIALGNYPIPIPYAYASSTPTESSACSRLGEVLADFLMEAEYTQCQSQYGYTYESCMVWSK